jgi:hypothetical protein
MTSATVPTVQMNQARQRVATRMGENSGARTKVTSQLGSGALEWEMESVVCLTPRNDVPVWY